MTPSTEPPASEALLNEDPRKTLEPVVEQLEHPPGDGEQHGPHGDAVERARDSLEATLAGLKLTPEEEKILAGEIRQLRELTKKLDETTIEIAAFGMVSRGKSSVLNALLGRDVFEVGATHGTTVTRSAQRWEQGARGPAGLDQARLILVDTPGIDEVGGEVRETLAREVARTADLILFIVSGDMQRREVRGALGAALASEAHPPRFQPDRPLSRGRPASRSTPSSRTSGSRA